MFGTGSQKALRKSLTKVRGGVCWNGFSDGRSTERGANKKWASDPHRAAATSYRCCLPALTEFRGSWPCGTCPIRCGVSPRKGAMLYYMGMQCVPVRVGEQAAPRSKIALRGGGKADAWEGRVYHSSMLGLQCWGRRQVKGRSWNSKLGTLAAP